MEMTNYYHHYFLIGHVLQGLKEISVYQNPYADTVCEISGRLCPNTLAILGSAPPFPPLPRKEHMQKLLLSSPKPPDRLLSRSAFKNDYKQGPIPRFETAGQ